MALNLKSAGGGGIILNPNTTPTDVTLNLPATAGTLATTEYLPAGTGAVATTVQSKLRESVSVKDFGAVGDGVTDDTVAIQAAVSSANNGEVFFPDPISYYLVTSAIVISANLSVRGTGRGCVVRRNTAGDIFQIGTAGLASRIDGVTFDKISFISPGNTGKQSAINAVASTPGTKQNITIKNCWFNGFYYSTLARPAASSASAASNYTATWYTSGLWANWQAQTDVLQLRPDIASSAVKLLGNTWTVEIQNNYFENCNIGVYAENSGGGPVDYICIDSSNTFINCATPAILVNINKVVIERNTIEFNYAGPCLFGVRPIDVHTNHFEGNELHHLYLGQQATVGASTNGKVYLNKFQPLNGDRSLQMNDIVAPFADTIDIDRNEWGGATVTQTAFKGWQVLAGASSNRIAIDTSRESSDGYAQISVTNATKIVKKLSGTARQVNYMRTALPMQDGLNGVFEPFFYKHPTTINGLATGLTSLSFQVPTGMELIVTGYALELTTITGAPATALIGSLVNGSGNNIIRLTTVTLPTYMGATEKRWANIANDVVRKYGSGNTVQFEITTAAAGGTVSAMTVTPIITGFLI
jgi:hypothetical protein